MLELLIDPKTGDFVSDGKGGFVRLPGERTSVQMALEIHLGEDWAYPEHGSRVKRLAGASNAVVQAEAERACGWLVTAGRISPPEVVVSSAAAATRREIAVSYLALSSSTTTTIKVQG